MKKFLASTLLILCMGLPLTIDAGGDHSHADSEEHDVEESDDE
jgi:hypothetical protein